MDTTPSRADGATRAVPAWVPAAVVLAVLVLTTLVRLRLAGVPLERDEGEYAYAGRLILGGVPPYELAYNMKLPGTYYAYAAILALFGRTAWGVHAGLAVVSGATAWLLFRLGRRLLGDLTAVVAATAFALLSLDRGIMGIWGHATHFAALAVVAGLLVLHRAHESGRRSAFVWTGVLLGTAVLMKQHAVFFVPLGAALAFRGGPGRVARAAAVCVGAVIPLAAVVGLCAWQGVLGRFWFWTVVYAAKYVQQVPASQAAANFADGFGRVVGHTLPLWIGAGAGLVALFADRANAGRRAFVLGLLAASALALCPGFFFREHYFILALPAVALLLGVAVVGIEHAAARVVSPRTARLLACGAFAALAARYVAAERDYLFTMTPADVSRARYGVNPFVEAPEIARYVRDRTEPGDRVAVLGSEPEICFYADRIAATGYLYTYALMEDQPFASRMQREMIAEIEAARPAYVVLVQIQNSWLAWEGSDRHVFEWGERWTAERYDLVGIADIASATERRVLWDDAVRGYRPVSENLVLTFRRKDFAPKPHGR